MLPANSTQLKLHSRTLAHEGPGGSCLKPGDCDQCTQRAVAPLSLTARPRPQLQAAALGRPKSQPRRDHIHPNMPRSLDQQDTALQLSTAAWPPEMGEPGCGSRPSHNHARKQAQMFSCAALQVDSAQQARCSKLTNHNRTNAPEPRGQPCTVCMRLLGSDTTSLMQNPTH